MRCDNDIPCKRSIMVYARGNGRLRARPMKARNDAGGAESGVGRERP